MPGLTLYTSNRLEVLARELADRLRRPGDPLQTDIIIVQSRGMERWLSLAIARRNGITANCRFPFPQAFIDELKGKLSYASEDWVKAADKKGIDGKAALKFYMDQIASME